MTVLPVPDEDMLAQASAEAADAKDAFVVDLEGYEGPLHLLLDLARRHKIDLVKISILQLADQYLGYVREAQAKKIDLAADFVDHFQSMQARAGFEHGIAARGQRTGAESAHGFLILDQQNRAMARGVNAFGGLFLLDDFFFHLIVAELVKTNDALREQIEANRHAEATLTGLKNPNELRKEGTEVFRMRVPGADEQVQVDEAAGTKAPRCASNTWTAPSSIT